MSSLRGEQALKDGLSFEFTWTARHMLEVMEERAEAITLGGLPGEKGVDFRLHFAAHEEHHQVKRAFGTEGAWTLAALDSEKVLPDFMQRLANPKVHCYMVSGIPAVQLGYLADRARRSPDLATFESAYLTGDYAAWFAEIERRWSLPRDECRQRLQRVFVRPFSEPDQTSCGHTMLRSMVVSDAEHTWTLLRDFCFSHVHQRVTASEVWQWLESKGIERQIFNNDPRVVARIEAQTKRYMDGVRQKLIKPPLSRQIATTVVCSLAESSGGEDMVILGSPGGGKSAVMLQITEACISRGWPVLAFRLDDLPATLSAQQLQEALDLPSSPAACMARCSAGKPALVVIDQLDAVSQYSGRTGTLFARVAAFVEDLRAHRLRNPIHLVIACREIDWKQDGHIRTLHRTHSADKDEGIYKVESLADEEINQILRTTGFNTAMFSPRQREHLLRRPQYLALLIETRPDDESLQDIVTPKDLYDAYWSKKQSDLALALPSLAGNPWFEILKHITDRLAETALALAPTVASSNEDGAPLAVTRSSLDRFSPSVINWMLTNGVLAEGHKRVRFGHESFFDYCFARFFEERGQSLLDYLLQSEQTLIQRGQLRQVLAYQRDENVDAYLKSATELLDSEKTRPHLKHVLIAAFCEVPDPKEGEWNLIEPHIRKALTDMEAEVSTSVSCQVFIGFHGSLPLFKMACAKGAFSEWLQSSGPQAVARLFRMVHTHQQRAQKEVWKLLEPLVNDERYSTQLDALAHFFRASNSRETFEWLLDVMRRNYTLSDRPQHQVERFYSLAEDLAQNKPEWLAEWLGALILARSGLQEQYRYNLLRDGCISSALICSASKRASRAFLEHVLPAIKDALAEQSSYYYGSWSQTSRSSTGLSYVSPDDALFDSIVLALQQMLHQDHAYALIVLDQLRNSDLDGMNQLHAVALCHNDQIYTQLVSDYLAGGGNAFSTIHKGRLAACKMLEIHAGRLSNSQLSAIEATVLDEWPKYEQEKNAHPGGALAHACLGNGRGERQMHLLRAFPKGRLSDAGAKRLAEWERKFDSVRTFRGPPRKETPLNRAAVAAWKPERFLCAIRSRQNRTPKSWRHVSESAGNIGTALRETVANYPAEFIHFLGQCDADTPKTFIEEIDSGLINLELSSELALEAARQFRRLGPEWSRRAIRLLEKAKNGNCQSEAFAMAVDFAKHGKGVTELKQGEEGTQGSKLRSLALNCTRGLAIGTVRQMLWAEPELLKEIKSDLPKMMSDPCPAIRTELASLCYAVAFKKENQAFATELFLRLITDRLPDEHVLSSDWPVKFIRTGMADDWNIFRPILVQMQRSLSSEVRSTAARLICIAVVSGIDAIELAKQCVASTDPKVRASCAEILSHNLDAEHGRPWTTEALLKLADDTDNDVCQAIGFGFHSDEKINFGHLADFLARYAKTRAFVRNAGHLIDALVESRSVLPATIFDIVDTIIHRLDEPVEDGADRLIWHIDMVIPILTRLYHENRDGTLRKRALDLIDKFCVNGSFSHVSLDQ